ncbi:MAG: sulfatase-like hydrolase/transferase [bacterium]|nr:sulfatase-like hydrolase/transferase [bacterium]
MVITYDTTRADRLSCYGYDKRTSPNLDALADDGIRFDTAISQAALTPVSHASIFSGLLPQHHGVRVMYAAEGYRLPREVPTLATILAAQGSKTAAFLSAFPVSEFFGFDAGFDEFDNGLDGRPEGVLTERKTGAWDWESSASQRRSDQTTDRALEWLGETKEPFCLWVHYWDPHDASLRPPREVNQRFLPPPSAGHWARYSGLYDAEVFYVDQQLGRLLDALKNQERYDSTVIVVVADHGQGLGDHDHWYHRILYQEQIRVPLVMRLPGGPKGRVIPELVRTIDILPTILEALEVNPPERSDGRSLRGLVEGRTEPSRTAYAEALVLYDLNARDLLQQRPDDELLHCMMDKSWKLIYRPLHPEKSELYHLDNDPRETNNLFAQEPEQAARLLAELEQLDPFVAGPFGAGTDQEALDHLRSLGYTGD